jgi:aryl-alcohol dehydrogenase-like predicted oxidoreductase
MRYRTLGRTGIRVSVLVFGAGPVSGLMTGDDTAAQAVVLRRAVERGINWIDTAPGYGQGLSEANLGRALREVDGAEQVHLATKVRLTAEQLVHAGDAVRSSVEESLRRLGRPVVTLLQLHNGITDRRGDDPFSLAPADVLGPEGVLAAMRRLRDAGLVRHLGLTGTGHPEALREVLRSGEFDTVQVPFNLLNPSAGQEMPASFEETNYGNIIAECDRLGVGVFAIRVFAAGALLGEEPSAHTRKTPFFPLALYERDRARAAELARRLEGGATLKEAALRFVLDRTDVHSAIIGFGAPEHIDEAADIAEAIGEVGGESSRYMPTCR